MSSPDADNPESLLARARAHDSTALARLLELHAERLLGYVRTQLGERLRQRLESQDVLQQVYLDALHSIDQFEDRGRDSFFAWLRRIALNRICDMDRMAFQTVKRGAETRVADLGRDESMGRLLSALSGALTSPTGAVRHDERESLLRRALLQLGEDQRQVIELRYLNQLSVTATAAKMDRTENAVRSLCVRALIRLRELLGDAI